MLRALLPLSVDRTPWRYGINELRACVAFRPPETLSAAGQKENPTLTWLDRSGKQVSTLGEPATFGQMQLSPDRNNAAVAVTKVVQRFAALAISTANT